MHPLVYDKEVLKNNEIVKTIFENEIIKVPELTDVYQNSEDKRAYYVVMVRELFKKMFGVDLEAGEEDIFTYWKYQCSLGEIHSLAMCFVCGCHLFLSDDKGAKRLAVIIENDYLGNINVYNRDGVRLVLKDAETPLNRSEWQAFTHVGS